MITEHLEVFFKFTFIFSIMMQRVRGGELSRWQDLKQARSHGRRQRKTGETATLVFPSSGDSYLDGGPDKTSLSGFKRPLSASSHEKSLWRRWPVSREAAERTHKRLQSSAAFSAGCEDWDCSAQIGKLLSSTPPTLNYEWQKWKLCSVACFSNEGNLPH